MPKITRTHGSGTLGSRRSDGSRNGLVLLAPNSACFGAVAAGVGARSGVGPGLAGSVPEGASAVSSVVSLTGAGSLDRVELAAHALGELRVGILELLDTLRLEHLDDVVVLDAEAGEVVDHLAGRVVGAGDR